MAGKRSWCGVRNTRTPPSVPATVAGTNPVGPNSVTVSALRLSMSSGLEKRTETRVVMGTFSAWFAGKVEAVCGGNCQVAKRWELASGAMMLCVSPGTKSSSASMGLSDSSKPPATTMGVSWKGNADDHSVRPLRRSISFQKSSYGYQ